MSGVNKRGLLAGLLVVVVLLLGGGASGRAAVVAQPQPQPRPNIVFVVADDLSDAELMELPRVRALLAEQGTTFTNFFASVPLCCPSRASILRGQYAHNHTIFGNSRPDGGFVGFHDKGLEQSTIATWLHDGGYRTALFGKYLNQYPEEAGAEYVPPGWSEWYGVATETGYMQYGYRLNENGRLVSYGRQPEDYLTDVLAGHAEGFIRRSAAAGQPFFVYMAPMLPHSPSTPAPRHQSAYAGLSAPRPPSFNEADVSDKPAWVREQEPLTPMQQRQIDSIYRRRMQSMLSVEEMLDRLFATLEQTGTLENTYIVFTSDHGYHLGHHRLFFGKLTAYEEDVRVRMVVRGPGVPAGKTVEQLAGNIDLAPTFAHLAGVAVPEFVDGRSLVPLWGAEPPAAWRQAFLLEQGAEEDFSGEPQYEEAQAARGPRGAAQAVTPAYRGLRTPRYKYVEYTTGERELYDLAADPNELDNLAGRPEVAPLLAELTARLATLRACSGATCDASALTPNP